jgi:uncharacterized protein YeaO (DUF488 family)
MIMINIKRAYELAAKEDGYRVLIDRLWPRGIKKSNLILDEWAKELAPSTALRRSFGHESEKWREFRSRYKMELRNSEARKKLESLAKRARKNTVTLVYSARNTDRNDAVVLKEILDRMVKLLSAPAEASRKTA